VNALGATRGVGTPAGKIQGGRGHGRKVEIAYAPLNRLAEC
jgi:hypothetical protein